MNETIPQPDKSNKEKKPFIFYLIATLIPLVLFLILGELLMAILITPQKLPAVPLPSKIDPYKPNPYLVNMKPYLHVHIPQAKYTQARADYQVEYEINSRGFRGNDIIVPKPKNFRRLIVIGDSIVEGHGNDFSKTFTSLLNRSIRNMGWEAINAGVQAASPIYYAANIDRYLALQPDAVLIMLFENDIGEDRMKESSYFELPYFDDVNKIAGQSFHNVFYSSNLYIALKRLERKFIRNPLEDIIARNHAFMVKNEKYQSLVKPFFVEPSVFDQQWKMSQEYLDYAVNSFRQQDIQVLVTNFSLRQNSDPSYETYSLNLDEHISRWAKTKSLPHLSLLPMMAQAYIDVDPLDIYIQGDGHPTSTTHMRIESTIRPWLLQNLSH